MKGTTGSTCSDFRRYKDLALKYHLGEGSVVCGDAKASQEEEENRIMFWFETLLEVSCCLAFCAAGDGQVMQFWRTGCEEKPARSPGKEFFLPD